MADPSPVASRREGTLLLADISGYTGFLQGVSDAHRALIVDADEPPAAYGLMSTLFDAMLGEIEPTFRVAKFEGDAVFAVADDGAVDGSAVLDSVRACYAAFRRQLTNAGTQWTCQCNACAIIGDLDLKFVVHHGSHVAQPIAGHEELLGPDVNLVHRLLKNHARDLVGPAPYALFTDAATAALSIPTDEMTNGQETYDGGPPVAVHILVLEAPAALPA
jgi:class 3 adenylate cyclase